MPGRHGSGTSAPPARRPAAPPPAPPPPPSAAVFPLPSALQTSGSPIGPAPTPAPRARPPSRSPAPPVPPRRPAACVRPACTRSCSPWGTRRCAEPPPPATAPAGPRALPCSPSSPVPSLLAPRLRPVAAARTAPRGVGNRNFLLSAPPRGPPSPPPSSRARRWRWRSATPHPPALAALASELVSPRPRPRAPPSVRLAAVFRPFAVGRLPLPAVVGGPTGATAAAVDAEPGGRLCSDLLAVVLWPSAVCRLPRPAAVECASVVVVTSVDAVSGGRRCSAPSVPSLLPPPMSGAAAGPICHLLGVPPVEPMSRALPCRPLPVVPTRP